jgi:chromosome segregation protein
MRLESQYVLKANPLAEASEEVPSGAFVSIRESAQTLQSVAQYLESREDVIGELSRVVCDPSTARPNWAPLLDGFYLVRSRDSFSSIVKDLGMIPTHLVSLEGDVLWSNGCLDLAAIESSEAQQVSGLIQRKRLISELKGEETTLQEQLFEAQAKLEMLQTAFSQAKEKFRQLAGRLASLNPDVERHTLFLRQVEAQVARLQEKEELLKGEIAEIGTQSASLEQRSQELAESLASSQLERQSREEDFERHSIELREAEQQLRESAVLVDQTRAQTKSLDRQIADLENKRSALAQEKLLTQARLEQLQGEIQGLDLQLVELRTKIEENSLVQNSKRLSLNQAESEETESSEKLLAERQQARTSQALVDQVNSEVQKLFTELAELEQNLAVHEVELKNLSERIEASYQIKLADLSDEQLKDFAQAPTLEEIMDPESGKRRAQQIRNRIDNLGKINMVAVEEFEELRKRYEYIFIQREDLSEGLRQLRDAIDRIDRESKERFAQAFQAVNEAFQKTFPILFGGGNAELRLTDPTNLLETGVDIVAQPPGKKLQSISLLSGGEKALTAVSLIFGIFSIKPSPFCVLDEVDAPLDDANVGRFNKAVREITQTSQVIMITHHKKTMESCDSLYGVTMEQPGISKLASVRIAQLKN